MNRLSKLKWLAALPVLCAALHSSPALACAACFGNAPDSRLAQGMNAGIFSLLAVVACVLSAVATFFIYLVKKSAAAGAQAPEAPEMLPTTQKA